MVSKVHSQLLQYAILHGNDRIEHYEQLVPLLAYKEKENLSQIQNADELVRLALLMLANNRDIDDVRLQKLLDVLKVALKAGVTNDASFIQLLSDSTINLRLNS